MNLNDEFYIRNESIFIKDIYEFVISFQSNVLATDKEEEDDFATEFACQYMFNTYDKNNDGFIDFNEFKKIEDSETGLSTDEEKLKEFEDIDLNKDGKISFQGKIINNMNK